ncbi:MAG TPA: NRDE family protein [Streptosporangiaceae bacterium]|nr:NRDE family protein [Streptosporangiaceae bacterium]
MCLLIALSGVVPGAPLIVAANRDEFYRRPAVTMTTLRDAGPRVLGGQDELAGGTWLAVNEHGVVAGLTNQPAPGGRDLTKRSRGELPLAFTAYDSAEEAVTRVCATLDPAAYNPCWLLVGDRHALYSIGLAPAQAGGRRPQVERLPPGVHVLENLPLRAPSAKVDQVTAMVNRELAAREEVTDALAAVLRDHRPAVSAPEPPAQPGGRGRPPALTAACVHTEEFAYGTRSALIVTVLAAGPPRLRVADGPPCQVPLEDMTALWEGSDRKNTV